MFLIRLPEHRVEGVEISRIVASRKPYYHVLLRVWEDYTINASLKVLVLMVRDDENLSLAWPIRSEDGSASMPVGYENGGNWLWFGNKWTRSELRSE